MALLMSSKQDVFFSKLFGPGSPEAQRVLKYQAAGYDFDTSLYSITASKAGVPVDALTLTASTISLLNGTLKNAVVVAQNKLMIADWLKSLPTFHAHAMSEAAAAAATVTVTLTGLTVTANKLVAIKAVMAACPVTVPNPLGHAKQLVEQLQAGATEVLLGTYPTDNTDVVKKLGAAGVLSTAVVNHENSPAVTVVKTPVPLSVPVVAKPTSTVIALKDAKALGQKVHGTSPGSVYHVIALTDTVKVAARLNATGAISIRAEWEGNAAEAQQKLAGIGMSMKAGYASWHLDAAGVPFARVIGAFLMDTGIVWDASVKTGTDLVIS